MRMLRNLLAVAVLAGSLSIAGCYVETVGPEGVVTGNYGYDPIYYNGYMVYYDGGRPFYYLNGAVVWISPTDPYYHSYITHWRTYGAYYGRWNGAYGARYRGYRTPHAYYGGHRAYRAPARPAARPVAPARTHHHP